MVAQTYEHYKIKKKLGIALRRYMLTNSPCKHIRRLVGLEKHEFKSYIAAQLRHGMSLNNYGEAWVLDHIVPLFLFDHGNDEELKVVWNYANVIPMALMLNRVKGVSAEFSQAELTIRAKAMPWNPVLPALQERMNLFSDLMRQQVSDETNLHKAAFFCKPTQLTNKN